MSLGIVLSIATAILFGLSVALQKYSINKMRTFSVKSLAKNRRWLFSVLVGIVGVFTYLYALAIEDLSTVQTITSFSIVIPIVIGFSFFKERVGGWKWVMVALMVIGVALISVS